MQQDAILIFHIGEPGPKIDSTQGVCNVSIEFSNSKSQELFGVDLQAATESPNLAVSELADEKLKLPQFIQLENSVVQDMNEEAKRHNAMRVLLESEVDSQDGLNASLELISLSEIIMD